MKLGCSTLGLGLFLLAELMTSGQQILWQFTNDVPQSYFSGSPAVGDDGTIYIGTANESSSGNKLYAITPDGTQRWQFVSGSRITTTPVVGANGTIYCGSATGTVFAITSDGSLAWQYNTGARDVRHVALSDDGTIYVAAPYYPVGSPFTKSKLYALSEDGVKRWEFSDSATTPDRQPVINFDGTVYFSTTTKFYALNPDGTVYWSLPIQSGTAAIGADGTIYVGGTDDIPNSIGLLRALNQDGTADWSFPAGSTKELIGADGTIYFSQYALSPQGEVKQESRTSFDSGVVAADGTLYARNSGNLAAIGSNGGIKWQVSFPSGLTGSPALMPDGTLYISDPTRLYAVKVLCGLANSPWPMDGHDLKRTGQARLGSQVRPCLSPIRLASGRGFQFTMIGEIGVSYRIEASADLATWAMWTNFVCTNSVTHFTDAGATNQDRRFYRAVSP